LPVIVTVKVCVPSTVAGTGAPTGEEREVPSRPGPGRDLLQPDGRFTKVRFGSRAGRWLIVATVLGSGMAGIDATVVGIALPSMGRELHTQLAALQWVVSGYMLTLAALLLPAGALGDRFGRKRVFSIGVLWFTVASAACAAAPNPPLLIALRVLQGVGAALLTPGSLSLIQASFDPADRARAIGAWSGMGGVATAAGPLLGGYLLTVATWRWIFLINVPLGVAVLFVTARYVPESRNVNAPASIDGGGSALAVIALLGLTYGLIEGPTKGYAGPLVVAAFAVTAITATMFFVVEQRSKAPMVPFSVLKVRQFNVTNLETFVVYAALGGALLLVPVELQVTDRYSPFASGAALLPLTAVMLALSSRSGRLSARFGPRLQMSVGPLGVGAGLLLLQRATSDRSYLSGVLPAVAVLALGLAATVAPLTATAMGSLSDEHAGLASAINNDVARLGSLIAVASLPSLSGLSGSAYLHPASVAHGFRLAMLITACMCGAGGLIAAAGIRNRPPPALGFGGPDHRRSIDAT
jgi:EmrB/QacA subfamily drug resistance transporter